jgi:hypothetical protein
MTDDAMEKGRVMVILGGEVTAITQELHGRLEADLSKADEDAITVACQKALIAGAKAARAEPGITNWELPMGDQWVKNHGSGQNGGGA